MSDNPLTGKVGLDTTDFKTAVAQLNREVRSIESGFRASASALGDWSKDASGLELRIESLNQLIDVQEKKVGALQTEYQRLAAEKGANSIAAQELEIKINKETERLNKMRVELKDTEGALEGMGKESKDAAESVDDLGDKADTSKGALLNFKSVAGGLGVALKGSVMAVAGLAAAVAGVGAAVGGLVLKTAETSGELVDLSLKTGISTERLQELAYVGDMVGTGADTMTTSLARLIRSMSDASDQSKDYSQKAKEAAEAGKDLSEIEMGEAAAAFQRLGVSVTDSNGNFRDSETVFYEALDALGKMSNETERDAIAMEIFGRSAMELNPLIKAGAEEIANLSKEAHEVGAVMSEDNVAAMEEFGDTLASLKLGLQGTLGTLASAFLPGFKGLAGEAQGYLKEFAGVVEGADGDLGKMAVGIGNLARKIAADVAQSAPQMMQAGLTIITGIVQSIILSLPKLIPAAVQMITSLIKFIAQSLPMLTQSAVDLVLALVNGILPQLPTLLETAIEMILTLAEGLTEALPQLIPAITAIMPLLVTTLLSALPLIIDAALQLIIALGEGLTAALPDLISYVPTIIQAIYDAIFDSLPMIATAAMDLISTLIDGILNSLPKIGLVAGELVGVFVKGVGDMGDSFLQVGIAIVKGVWDGILSKTGWFLNQVTQFFANIVNSVKESLGIRSPSRVFGDIGENMALGLGKGFLGSFGDIERQITGAVNGMQFSPSLAAAGGSGLNGMNYSFGNIYVDARGATDPQRVSVAVKDGVLSALRSRGV